MYSHIYVFHLTCEEVGNGFNMFIITSGCWIGVLTKLFIFLVLVDDYVQSTRSTWKGKTPPFLDVLSMKNEGCIAILEYIESIPMSYLMVLVMFYYYFPPILPISWPIVPLNFCIIKKVPPLFLGTSIRWSPYSQTAPLSWSWDLTNVGPTAPRLTAWTSRRPKGLLWLGLSILPVQMQMVIAQWLFLVPLKGGR